MYTLGASIASGDKQAINFKKAFFNPILIAFVVGLILNLIKSTEYLPEIAAYSNHLKGLVTPISMLILGIKLGGVKFSSLFSSWKTYYVSAIKLILFPVLVVGIMLICRLVLAIEADMIMGMFIAFAVPTAGSASAIADEYNGDSQNAVIFTLGTTILSSISLPVLYWLITFIIG